MFYFRINKMKIFDNRECGFLFFRRDLAELKILSLVTAAGATLPSLDEWVNETDPAKKRQALEAAITGAVQAQELTEASD